MRRIRTIKPEFWQDEKLAPMPPVTRLVFLGLISMADDAGRLIDNPKTIDGFLFGATRDSAKKSLETLASAGRILRYQSGSGQALIQIVGWTRHQKVDKPSKYSLPAPDTHRDDSRDSREYDASSSAPYLGPWTGDLVPATGDQLPGTTATTTAGEANALDGEAESSAALWRRFRSHIEFHCGDASWTSWAAECRVARDGMHGPALPPDQLARAVSDYIGNGETPNLSRFRGYLAAVGRPKPAAPAVRRSFGWRDQPPPVDPDAPLAPAYAANVSRRRDADPDWWDRMRAESAAAGRRNEWRYAYEQLERETAAAMNAVRASDPAFTTGDAA